eukprot:360955-Chlamydomonas_euryale.AAC.3
MRAADTLPVTFCSNNSQSTTLGSSLPWTSSRLASPPPPPPTHMPLRSDVYVNPKNPRHATLSTSTLLA